MANDLYAILGVARSASDDEIRSAYRKLARKYHPDVNPGDAQAEARFKEVAAAYEVLADDKKRKNYDEFGDEALRGGFDPDKAREYQKWKSQRAQGASPFAQSGFDGFEGFDLGDILNFGGFGRRQKAAGRGTDLRAVVTMSLKQAITGGEVKLSVEQNGKPITVRIPPGADDGSTIRLKGRGAPGPSGAGDLLIETKVEPHPLVRRSGLDLEMTVPVTLDEAYNGGAIDVPTFDGAVKLKVPPRAQSGSRLRLRGKGVARGDTRGDFFVVLDVRLPDKHDDALAEAIKNSANAYTRPVREEVAL